MPPDHPAFQVPHGKLDYATWFIRKKTNDLIGHFGFNTSDRDDITQELVIDLVERWDQFDPAQSQPQSFIAQVVRNMVSKLIRHQQTKQQVFEMTPGVIDEEAEEEVTTCFRTDQPRRINQEFIDLETDVAVVIGQLPEDLAALCDELKSKTVAEISRDSGVPETTVWDRVALIRPYFEAQAIEDYL